MPLPFADLGLSVGVVALAVAASDRLTPEVVAAVVIGLTWCVALPACGAWHPRARPATVVRAGAATAVVSWVAGATVLPPPDGRQVAVTAALVATALLGRTLARSAVAPTRVVVAGDVADLGPLVDELHRTHGSWTVVSACIDPVDPQDPSLFDEGLRDVPLHLDVTAVTEAASATGAGAVALVPGRTLDAATIRRCTWAAHAAGLEVFVVSGLLDVRAGRVRPVSVGHAGLLHVAPRTAPTLSRAAKHALDRTAAALVIVALLPLLVLITAAVRCESPGSPFFVQRRTGRDGSTFRMFKFRTMHVDAEARRAQLAAANECDGVLFKMREDPRVTRVGRVLRRYSLDELPQLLNVLRGEMSLIGPRPALPVEVEQYDADPRRRLAVRPGLTGLWQVSGRSDLSWEESVRLDLHYVDNWSWSLDLGILLRTVSAVLSHRGAY